MDFSANSMNLASLGVSIEASCKPSELQCILACFHVWTNQQVLFLKLAFSRKKEENIALQRSGWNRHNKIFRQLILVVLCNFERYYFDLQLLRIATERLKLSKRLSFLLANWFVVAHNCILLIQVLWLENYSHVRYQFILF